MLLQCQRACSEIRGDKAESNHEITVEVRGDYPNFKQNLDEKLSSQKSAEASRCLANAVSEQQAPKVDNCVLSKEPLVGKQKSS